MDQKQLFRKAAIDKLASPEQLDVLMQVTSPKGWIALWSVGGILVGVVVWSIFGTIPERIDGQGILIRGGGLREIKATSQGVLTRLDLTINGSVMEGMEVGEIELPGLEERRRNAVTSKSEIEASIEGNRAMIGAHNADIRHLRAQLREVNQRLEDREAS